MAIRSDFTPTATYDVETLNRIYGNLTRHGCIGLDDLRVVYKDGKVIVGEGNAILPNLRMISVDKGGHTIDVGEDPVGYVYIEDDRIIFGEMPFEKLKTVLFLARVDKGKIVDLRSRAEMLSEKGEG